jgi:hypothetical protein
MQRTDLIRSPLAKGGYRGVLRLDTVESAVSCAAHGFKTLPPYEGGTQGGSSPQCPGKGINHAIQVVINLDLANTIQNPPVSPLRKGGGIHNLSVIRDLRLIQRHFGIRVVVSAKPTTPLIRPIPLRSRSGRRASRRQDSRFIGVGHLFPRRTRTKRSPTPQPTVG